jgi:hypothetical protein
LAHTTELRQVGVVKRGQDGGGGGGGGGGAERVTRGIKACVRDVVLDKKTIFCWIGREAL